MLTDIQQEALQIIQESYTDEITAISEPEIDDGGTITVKFQGEKKLLEAKNIPRQDRNAIN